MPPIKSSGIGAQKPFHPRHQIGLGRLHHQVKMVGHQTEGMHLPVRFAAAFAQGFQKAFPVGIILEYRLPPVAPVHHMINRPFIFQSKFACHRAEYCQKTYPVSIVRTDPFMDPYAYLREVLTRLPNMTNWQIPEVTPQAWAKNTAASATASCIINVVV